MSPGGCSPCRLRSGLLAELGGVLDLRARDRSRLAELLACDDLELIERLGGRRSEELLRAHGQGRLAPDRSWAQAICVHDGHFPRRLRSAGAPRLLYTAGDAELLRTGRSRPAVAMLGTPRPSAYGIEMARSLACGLAVGGVTVVTLLGDGIARATLAGCQRGGRGAVGLTPSGLAPDQAAACAGSGDRTSGGGCLAAELPPGCSGRRWGRLAAERTAVALSDVVLVVETEPGEQLLAVELARATGRRIAAVPGPATAPLARGPLQLLREGAALVCCAEDLLELLGRSVGGASPRSPGDEGLPAGLAALLVRVGSGEETLERLLSGADREEALLGLARLELKGLVRRTHDGRYIPAAGSAPAAGPGRFAGERVDDRERGSFF